MLAQVIFKIPVSHMDNERGLSIAGIVSKNRRSRIGVSTIENITSIYYNLQERTHNVQERSETSDPGGIIDAEIEQISIADDDSQ